MIYAVDFDGTLCANAYPEIGAPRPEMIRFVKSRRDDGDKIILWTCRCGAYLEDALTWCRGFGLEFDAVNDNLAENIACYSSNSRKVCADYYIDDRNFPFSVDALLSETFSA